MSENKDDGKKEKKALNVMLIAQIAFAVVNLGVLGYGGYMVYAATLGWRAPQITETELRELREKTAKDNSAEVGPLVYTMDKFIVNLAGDPLRDPKRTISMEVNLEMLNKEGFEEVLNTENRAKARDRIIQILGSKYYAELETIQGKLFLKDQIATEISSLLDKGVVKDVYFSNFVVQ
jgi:flagellar FliL protein